MSGSINLRVLFIRRPRLKNMLNDNLCLSFEISFRKREASAAYDPSVTPKAAESKARSGGGGGGGRGRQRNNDEDGEDDDMQPHKSLEKLLRETKKKVQKSKTIWEKLSQQFCNGISKDYSSQMCWNGTGLVKPDKNKTAEEQETRPPPQGRGGSGGPTNALVADQILVLQFITEKLRASYNGLDVQWVEEIGEFDT